MRLRPSTIETSVATMAVSASILQGGNVDNVRTRERATALIHCGGEPLPVGHIIGDIGTGEHDGVVSIVRTLYGDTDALDARSR